MVPRWVLLSRRSTSSHTAVPQQCLAPPAQGPAAPSPSPLGARLGERARILPGRLSAVMTPTEASRDAGTEWTEPPACHRAGLRWHRDNLQQPPVPPAPGAAVGPCSTFLPQPGGACRHASRVAGRAGGRADLPFAIHLLECLQRLQACKNKPCGEGGESQQLCPETEGVGWESTGDAGA